MPGSDANPPRSRVIEGAVCAGCATLCDDLRLEIQGETVRLASPACERAREWIRGLRPLAEKSPTSDGEPADLDAAIARAAELLRGARAPWVVLGPDLGLAATQEVFALAKATFAPVIFEPPEESDPRAGIDGADFAATRGDVAASAGVVIVLGADPDRDLPRFLELHAPPKLASDGAARRLVVVDVAGAPEANRTASRADEAIRLPPGDRARSMLGWVRSLAIEISAFRSAEAMSAPEVAPGEEGRIEHEVAEMSSGGGARDPATSRLARELLATPHSHFYIGREAAGDAAITQELRRLASSLRDRVRVTASALPSVAGRATAQTVAAWAAASPGPIAWLEPLDAECFDPRFDRAPRRAHWIPGVFSVADLARERFADIVILAGIENPSGLAFPSDVLRLGIGRRRDGRARVWFEVPGLDPRLASDVIRDDGVLLRLSGDDREAPLDPAVDILRRLRSAVGVTVADEGRESDREEIRR